MSGRAKPLQTIDLPIESEALRAAVEAVASEQQRVALERDGVIVAVLVSPKDLERLQHDDARTEDWRANVAAIRAAFADIPEEQRMRDVAAVMAEVRAEMWAEVEVSRAASDSVA